MNQSRKIPSKKRIESSNLPLMLILLKRSFFRVMWKMEKLIGEMERLS